jgi:hypothetical protein
MEPLDLIMDVGMHDGTDTAFYLAKGFKVVAVEANPDLVAAGRARFAREIDEGRLTIVGAAITNERGVAQLACPTRRRSGAHLTRGCTRRARGSLLPED